MTPISPELRAFLADWLAWVERGAPEGEPYSRDDSLCWAAWDHPHGLMNSVYRELVQAFDADGLCAAHPFGLAEWERDHAAFTMHIDPNRLAWVRAKLAEGGEL